MKKHWDKMILAAIFLAAAAVRLYHFQTWLHFQLDQARDAMVIRKAVQMGISELPLLGPRAAGTYLRLGPIFYYFQYLSAKITGSIQPYVFAYPDLIWNILAIPLFYFFLRFYFRKISSLLGTALYAFSFIAVQYSRFAWNPNSVPFWTLLFLFCLVKFSRAEKEKEKYIWAAIGALALGIASQLHFLALVSLPIIAIVFLVWTKSYRNLNFKRVLMVLAILVALYIPVILSEIKTGGTNTLLFESAIGEKPSDNTFGQKFFKTIEVNSQYYLFLLTSNITLVSSISLVIGTIFITASLIFIFFKFRDEEDERRKNFLKMVFRLVLRIVCFDFPVRVSGSSAFFLYMLFFCPLYFLFFGLNGVGGFFRAEKILCRRHYWFRLWLTLSILTLNMEAVFAGFRSAAQDREPEFWRNRPFVAQEIEKIPLYQLRKAADYLAERYWQEKKKIHLGGDMTYLAPLQYLLEMKSPAVDFEKMSKYDDEQEEIYFIISRDKNGCYGTIKNLLGSEFAEAHFFGHRFALCELKLPAGFEATRPKKSPKIKKEKPADEEEGYSIDDVERKAQKRVFWGDILK